MPKARFDHHIDGETFTLGDVTPSVRKPMGPRLDVEEAQRDAPSYDSRIKSAYASAMASHEVRRKHGRRR